ncbi:aspartate-alanine antiporter [Bradyrhizobium lablabi]|jgi:putative transport protein|uniref:Aspartate-alanine antiporter n=3 Tax=Bradyrhizobium TaxID=374 RepID=A0ABY0PXR1_9BRAD|nr:aspartate-alanine antiporter [Bradyrhizobium ottawaense]SEC91541.1 aspartate-alanine antiporter [Bradyrhizobium lablabi]SHK99141.1 aspartate-alanine antiporter [Bradyrhizobium lablabi]
MDMIHQLVTAQPLLALFVTIALGYLAGKIRIGGFVLGGIAGTLLVGVLIGQFGVAIDSGIKGVFFALFIYAVGFQGGPQFFHALNRRSLNQLASAFVMCLTGLLCVLAAAWLFGLDRGLAAGLAAGGLTQSAIIGTAGDAIGKLGLSPELIKTMQTNVAVGYAVCYIFGSLGPIVMVSWFLPLIMRWNIRTEAVKLAKELSGGHAELEPGEFNAASQIATRLYEMGTDSKATGLTAIEIDRQLSDASVEAVYREGKTLDLNEAVVVVARDRVAITGIISQQAAAAVLFGREVTPSNGLLLVQENREIVLTNHALSGRAISEIHDQVNVETRHGVFLTAVKRMGLDLPVLDKLQLKRGDELHFTGSPADLDRVEPKIGYRITAAAITDFVFFGLGMSIGLLIGMIEFKIWGIPISIGSGGGCLLAGLLFGWLRSVHPNFAALPVGASNFLRDFGLAVFVGIVGITAGPQALVAIEKYGLTLFFLGVGVTLIPQILTFFFSYYVLRIQNPIEALACVAGGRSANPAFAALLTKAGNATPVVSFTVTYAVANVFLTLWGPLIVGIIAKNAS